MLPFSQGADSGSAGPLDPKIQEPRTPEQLEVIQTLGSYLREAEDARRSGDNPRDEAWNENIRRYWLREDFTGKASWQSQEVPPEFPKFVDRFAAALKEALVASGNSFYTVQDPADTENDLTQAVKRMTDVWLGACGDNASGTPMPFEAVFEDQTKLGALMAGCSCVLWRDDYAKGRVAVETVDPRQVWLDHTGRNLYRIRQIEMDKHKLIGLGKGPEKALYNLDELERMTQGFIASEERRQESLTGAGDEITSTREPVTLHEFYGDIVGRDGTVFAENALTIMANREYIIRGPEKNPFWHQRDWITYAPFISVPLSVYGRSYGEDFGHLADTFTKMTNLIIDAVTVSSMKIFAVVPEMLSDPGQLNSGLVPGKTFKLEMGLGPAKDFMHSVDMGTLSGDTVRVWDALKNMLREGADINEVGLGQFAPNSRTSATEISQTSQSSSAMVRSVAQSVERRLIEPTLDKIWKTGIQHVVKSDKVIAAAAGEEMFGALLGVRKELVRRPITFQARGISTLIQKSAKLSSLIQLLQIIASNEILLKQFMQVVDMGKLVDLLFDLSNIDMRRLETTERERLAQKLQEPLPQAGQGGDAPNPGAQGLAQMMGVGRG